MIEDSLSKIPSQHRGKPKFKAFLTGILEPSENSGETADAITYEHDIENARGFQLDIIGILTGIDRRLTFQPGDGSSPVLDDDTYQMLIRSKIARNHWNGQNGTISEIWEDIFTSSQLTIEDNQDMTMTAVVTNLGNTPLKQELIANGYIVPKPEGVRLKIVYHETANFETGLTLGAEVFDFGRTQTEVAVWQALKA